MLDQDFNRRYATRRPWRRHRPCFVPFACLSLVVASGCGSGQSALLPQASVEIIRGKDSAGATIELEKRGDDLTRARVIDVVLGTGEAEIISDANGHVEFTIDFPAGASVRYIGQLAHPDAPGAVTISGRWYLRSSGMFGVDTGTWRAPSVSGGEP